MGKVPKGMKVSVVSVVGAFRTGKSFLLTLILRFLRHRASHGDDASDAWLTKEGTKISEGNSNEGDKAEEGEKDDEVKGRLTRLLLDGARPYDAAALAAHDKAYEAKHGARAPKRTALTVGAPPRKNPAAKKGRL